MTLSSNVTNSASALKSLQISFAISLSRDWLIVAKTPRSISFLIMSFDLDVELFGQVSDSDAFGQRDLAEFPRGFDFG